MNDYLKRAKKGVISGGELQPIRRADSKELKELKKLPLYELDYSKVDDVSINKIAIYVKDETEAYKHVAELLEAQENPQPPVFK